MVAAIVYLTAVGVDVMDIDASQYAQMSMGMMKSGDYLHLFDRGKDYLDKPPFLFWVSSLSMKVFGANNFGYKFPSILFALWAVFATWRLAKLLYGSRTAMISAVVLASCQGMFLMTNDVRCDTILMSWVITAIWLLQEWMVSKKIAYFFAGCAAIAFGMMTKGPIALMVPVFAFFSDWALKREWKNFARPVLLAGVVLIAVLLIPMSIGLYQQYDAHPEKHISGLRFFYWSQSFGRITGESPWKNGADMSFLLLNMLWSFQPWIFVFLFALFYRVRQLVRQGFKIAPGQEWLSVGGFLLAYLSLGSSGYQLPHYIFVAFPLAAIVTGQYLDHITSEGKPMAIAGILQVALVVVLLVVVAILISWVFPADFYTLICFLVTASGVVALMFLKGDDKRFLRFVYIPAWGILVANTFLTSGMYRPLLRYQMGSMMGKYMKRHSIKADDLIMYKMHDAAMALNFYAGGYSSMTDSVAYFNGAHYVLTMDEGMASMASGERKYKLLYRGKLFKVSELTPEFLNPDTRNKELKNYYLLKLE